MTENLKRFAIKSGGLLMAHPVNPSNPFFFTDVAEATSLRDALGKEGRDVVEVEIVVTKVVA